MLYLTDEPRWNILVAWVHLSHIPRGGLLPPWCFSISHPCYLIIHLTLHICSYSFTSMFPVYTSFIFSFAMSLVRVWLHLLYSAREYQENKDGLVPKAAECWRSALCTCLCHNPCGMLGMSFELSLRRSLSLCSLFPGYIEIVKASLQKCWATSGISMRYSVSIFSGMWD